MKKFSIAAIILLMAAVGFVTTAQAEITVPPVDTEMTAVKPSESAVYTPSPAPQVSALQSYIATLDKKMDKSLKNQAYIGEKVRESIRKIDTLGVKIDAQGKTLSSVAERAETAIKTSADALDRGAEALKTASTTNAEVVKALEKATTAYEERNNLTVPVYVAVLFSIAACVLVLVTRNMAWPQKEQ